MLESLSGFTYPTTLSPDSRYIGVRSPIPLYPFPTHYALESISTSPIPLLSCYTHAQGYRQKVNAAEGEGCGEDDSGIEEEVYSKEDDRGNIQFSFARRSGPSSGVL